MLQINCRVYKIIIYTNYIDGSDIRKSQTFYTLQKQRMNTQPCLQKIYVYATSKQQFKKSVSWTSS